MSIYIDESTRLVVQGLTGREGSFHALRNRAYGTKVVAGVTPERGGQDVEGLPVFDTVEEAVEATGANASAVFVPARVAPDALYEAIDAGLSLVVCVTEGIPAQDIARLRAYLKVKGMMDTSTSLIGPNCPGLVSPGKCAVGIIPTDITRPGPVGVVSRSGTLTYEIILQLSRRGLGQSTCVGIGGDLIPGTGFVEVLARFEEDPGTRAVVLIGEIGGSEEERAAVFISERMTKPVLAYVAGFTAPVGRRMGHAGAIVSGSKGTASAKSEALASAGVPVARVPGEIPDLVEARL